MITAIGFLNVLWVTFLYKMVFQKINLLIWGIISTFVPVKMNLKMKLFNENIGVSQLKSCGIASGLDTLTPQTFLQAFTFTREGFFISKILLKVHGLQGYAIAMQHSWVNGIIKPLRLCFKLLEGCRRNSNGGLRVGAVRLTGALNCL